MDSLGLGIDTGGTFTDAVVVDMSSGAVVSWAKSPTTRADLAQGIVGAVRQLPPDLLPQVGLVSLSTTLATNAIVEGNGAPCCLILIGYDSELCRSYNLQRKLPTTNVFFVNGGHTSTGVEAAPLDERALVKIAKEQASSVAAFAVSGFFSVRNPDHELRARNILAEMTGLPVTCGHELASELDAVLRAATCALNGSLVPLLTDLMRSLQRALSSFGLHAPIMVVRGDGSLMRVEVALERPVETILSGPAASVVGARALTGLDEMLVVDIGGTTTDLAVVRDGEPELNRHGATVGGWQTLVRAIRTVSTGLGGDSYVRFDLRNGIKVGPRRVLPLAYIALDNRRVAASLGRAKSAPGTLSPDDLVFFTIMRDPEVLPLSSVEKRILDALSDGPQPLWHLADRDPWAYFYLSRSNYLERSGILMRSALTPTDALHVLGKFTIWDREAALHAMEFMGYHLQLPAEEVAQLILSQVEGDLVRVMVPVLAAGHSTTTMESNGDLLLNIALQNGRSDSDLEVQLHSRLPVVGLGAPAQHFVTPAAEMVHASAFLPQHYPVANAVGAISGSVVIRESIEVHADYRPSGLDGYRVTGPFPVMQFNSRDDAIAEAKRCLRDLVREKALAAGAEEVEVNVEERVQEAATAPTFGDAIYLGSTIIGTAVGRPRIGREDEKEEGEEELW